MGYSCENRAVFPPFYPTFGHFSGVFLPKTTKKFIFGKKSFEVCKKSSTFATKITTMAKLIGRKPEIKALSKYENSGKPEFVAVYGRRRVGKTFLIRQYFADRLCFYASGEYGADISHQLGNFSEELRKRSGKKVKLKDWSDAFWRLSDYIDTLPIDGTRKIIFLDELPWFDTQQSGFIRALDYFWNHSFSCRDDALLIVCCSATSWMVNNIINDRGGLHNRITHEIHLYPFTLHETEEYLQNGGFKWNRLTILQTYMILGGIPFYLDMLDKDETFPTNIDNLMFSRDAPLKNEFNRLYDSLFGRSGKYESVITALSKQASGLTRNEIAEQLGIKSGGNLTVVLSNLENCDFVRYYHVKRKKENSSNGIYQLTDFFTLFYFHFIKNRNLSANDWTDLMSSPKVSTWTGLAFERVCLDHIQKIKEALRIDTIRTLQYAWRSKDPDNKAQIDMVIERADNMTNICEIKYSKDDYTLTKNEETKLRKRMEAYKSETGTRNGLLLTLITTYGLTNNTHSGIVDNVVTLDDLFA